jgi:hypothetical protein
MTTKKTTTKGGAGGKAGRGITWKDLRDHNPLALHEVRRLSYDVALRGLEAEDARSLLVLFHAFTYEQDKADRERMLQQIKESFAWLFPAFDDAVRGEICRAVESFREGGADDE